MVIFVTPVTISRQTIDKKIKKTKKKYQIKKIHQNNNKENIVTTLRQWDLRELSH